MKNPVRVALRDGKTVRIKRCAGPCEKDKIVTDDSDSEFPINSRRPDGTVKSWKKMCKICWRRHERERFAAMSPEEKLELSQRAYARICSDPQKLARFREGDRRRQRKYRADPEKAARKRAQNRESARRRAKADPEAARDDRRMRYYLKREQEGQKTVPSRQKRRDTPRRYVSPHPLTCWLRAYKLATGLRSVQELANDLEIGDRHIRRLLDGETDRISLDVADRLIQAARVEVEVQGNLIFSVQDLYPNLGHEKEHELSDGQSAA